MQHAMQEMTIVGLVTEASLFVQAIMLILLLASLMSWFLILWRANVIKRIEKQSRRFHTDFRQSKDLYAVHAETLAGNQIGLSSVFTAGFNVFSDLRTIENISKKDIIDNVERAMLVNIGEHEAEQEKGLSYLATIGSVSPYIGLLGTVWGIMNSFIGLSQVEQATLNTVAPGIAEALIATAIGLFAAIPAVIAYNRLSSRSNQLMSSYYHFGNELSLKLQHLM